MYDSYMQGAAEVCADGHGIWWFIVWAYLWGIIVGNNISKVRIYSSFLQT
jgi:hypothetical protein